MNLNFRHIKPLFFSAILSLNLSFLGSLAHAQETKDQDNELIFYGADIISADVVTQEAILKGNVKILFDNYELSAKEARVSRKTLSFTAKDNVVITGNDTVIEADKVEINYKTRVGEIVNARITSGQLLLQAEKVLKLSNEVFEAKNGSFTTCSTCPPGWRIKAKSIKTNINKYIDLKGSWLQILNTSILPIPRIVMPLNTRRKSGLLFPKFSTISKRLGAEISVPYFWAITPHSDLTFSPRLYINLDEPISAKTHFEYRHLLSSESRLNLKLGYMYDSTYVNVSQEVDPLFRYRFSYNNFFKLPGNITQKTNLTLIRDRYYLDDFQQDVSGLNESSLLNSFALNKNYDHAFISAETLYNINLIKENPQAANDDAIHKAPELRHALIERPILGNFLFFKNDLTYTNFTRNSSSFDTVNTSPTNSVNDDLDPGDQESKAVDPNNGQFDATKDLLRTGHRLRLESELSAPFNLGRLFDVLPSISYRDSFYRFNVSEGDSINISNANPYNDFANAKYLEGRVSLRTELTKVYSGKYKHRIEPELSFRKGTPVDQTDNIFFRSQEDLPYHRRNKPISDFDFFDFQHGVQFDYHDRFFRAELAELNITNVLITKKYQDNVPFYNQPLFFNIRQGYDFKNAREATGANRDPWSNLEASLNFKFKRVHALATASHYHEAGVADFSARTRFIYMPGRYLQLRYDNTNIIDNAQNKAEGRVRTAGLAFGWELPTLQIQGNANYSLTDSQLQDWSFSLNYTPIGRCWDIRLGLVKPNSARRDDENDRPQISLAASFNLGPDNNYKKTLSGLNSSILSEKER